MFPFILYFYSIHSIYGFLMALKRLLSIEKIILLKFKYHLALLRIVRFIPGDLLITIRLLSAQVEFNILKVD